MHLVSQNADDTRAIARRFAVHVRDLLPGRNAALVIALHGELGTGKTTFTQALAQELGIQTLPKSPTFMLAREYPIPSSGMSLWHLDCYRLSGHRDLVSADLHPIFDNPANIVVVEWPERISDGLPEDRIDLHFVHAGGDKRSITIPSA